MTKEGGVAEKKAAEEEKKMPPPPATTASSSSKDEEDDDLKKSKAVRWSSDVQENKNVSAAPSTAKRKPPPAAASPAPPNNSVARLPTTTATSEARITLENDWELTWPIWHMLPWMERKEIAQRHGYQTIGAFEEYMSLQKALDDDAPAPYNNELVYPTKKKEVQEEDRKPSASTEDEDEEEEDSETEADNDNDKMTNTSGNSSSESEDDNDNKMEESDSLLFTFPDELVNKIFSFLPVTLYGTKLAYVSRHPHWKRITGSEAVMKQLCERVYLQQSKKKQLRVGKFHNSYRFMLYQRPRVQAGGGVYVLRFGRVKPIQRDMWTEVPVGGILETVYYRYLYFEEHGHCLYALSTIPPHDMLRRFHRVLLQSSYDNPETTMFADSAGKALGHNKKKAPRKLTRQEKEKRAAELDTRVVWGTYTIQKDQLTVTAKQSWQTVQFGLRIVTHHNRPYEEHEYLHHHHHPKEVKAAAPPPAKKPVTVNLKDDDDEYVNGNDAYQTSSPHGRFGVLQLETHRSSISGNFDEHDTVLEGIHPQVYHHSDVVNYSVEVDQVFRFLPDPRF